ncbi:HAMP domain-containing protein [Paenibacillus mucilaginosus]|uniref:Circadian input-output histidine kinase CikA n=1 Tax=Paenibacillus mucilaginosus (strain KNP414) TaxID=1036673 RepID=F8FLJ0_PAEMK|nr:HAMP domain-containing protein [Paenibacillus mucilaginosus]AEI44117.1 GAF sensor hybrid histidine kinase [Paenibacillus mucilaginosus KNP414]MCG7212409.1 HAMP domain-containing protein [Paenibacillus mucilaginosus]WDM25550.1 HAMP domain-containing protein [Paenibacillus mucilaginosus]WFA20212.1 response regulator [Paenibacillus mucilaginosus]
MSDQERNQDSSVDQLDTGELLNALMALKKGNFAYRMPYDHTGIAGKVADTFNEIMDMQESLATEIHTVATVVGKEGKLSRRFSHKNTGGDWEKVTESLNGLVVDLIQPTSEMVRVINAVAQGDLSQTVELEFEGRPLTGEFQRTANNINRMVNQLSTFASEVTRVAREVGTEGILGGQADVKGVSGTWKDLTDSVNYMATNLTDQVRNIAAVTTAVANGDLSKTITVSAKGEILELKNTINTMVDQLSTFSSEVTRVAREVGTEGKLGGQADVKGVSGTWRDLTESVNYMASNLTNQVRNIAVVTTAVANGDLSKKITMDVQGEILELKVTINTMVDQLSTFASEVTRVAREVGTEGELGGQADVQGVSGTWRDLTESVNSMASNLTNQVRNIAEVTTAVAQGDLSKKITVDAKGEILQLKSTINTMVEQLSTFASEVTRVAREVSTEGKLGGQADVRGVSGTWKDLTDSVNYMAGTLTDQVRNIAEVTTAVAKGDLSKQITVNARGEILELKNTINTMVEQLSTFASEVTRVAREVGTLGMLGGQAQVKGVAGTWRDLTESVNYMASNLTDQVRNIAVVTTAVANGDLSKKITADVQGEMFELKNTINTMVDQLSTFASEVTRVAREVGTEGKLGGQAQVKGVGGTWKDLTESVNYMASNLTDQVRNIADVTTAVAKGDLSRKITVDVKGEMLQLKSTINTMVDQLSNFASEVTRVAREVGTEGKLGVQADVKDVSGTWKDLTDTVNYMASNLTNQVRNIAGVTTAVANGDLSKKITVDVKGELLELKNTINTMVDQLNSFASEVTRVAREVGTDGKLGGQAQVRGVGGIWKDLTDNVNIMATNLTDQVRGIAKVVTAVANGNMKQKLTVEAKGEIAELADTINSMIDTLATFADQVTTVAREVGAEGKLGGQANVPGAAGTWRDLTDNVNYMASTLTTQVRAITNVATAVTKGDLSRSIDVAAAGEVATLKDNINEMIRNLKETTRINTEQDWLKTNLAKFSRLLQGQRDLYAVCRMILSELAPLVSMQHGVIYINEPRGGEPVLALFASYAFQQRKHLSNEYRAGQGLVGQCLIEKQRILLTNVPGDYVVISSGLGESTPLNIVLLPIIFEDQVLAVLELASFRKFTEIDIAFLDQLTESIGIVINTMQANQRTEELLMQSQSLTEELQKQQLELQNTNEELEEKAKLLVLQKAEVESKNNEVELAKRFLEEKAEQLALTSKYKSEFLANMSHELRTPLNSLLLLAEQLAENPDANLTDNQVKFAETIQDSGHELLNLINDILDLSKIESGTVTPDYVETTMNEITASIERTFRHMADDKKLDFRIKVEPNVPGTIVTDSKRLQQILKNLLSNAFKFTEEGQVQLLIRQANGGWSKDHEALNRAKLVLCFCVSDTGIGIPPEKQQIIFEAFQQADGSTNRTYGGTGLGLAISREIAAMLGGEITLYSVENTGSTFNLYLPLDADAPSPEPKPKYVPEVIDVTPPQKTRLLPRKSVADMIDDRERIQPGDRVFLIIEDDLKFNEILLELLHKRGIKAVITAKGSDALELAQKYKPTAITLDLRLKDMDGWLVIEHLKNDINIRHIPVCVITVEEDEIQLMQKGVHDYICKPVSNEELENALDKLNQFADRAVHHLLVVSSDPKQRQEWVETIGGDDVIVTAVDTGRKALQQLKAKEYDCVLADNALTDLNVLQFVREMQKNAKNKYMPVVINRTRKLTPEEESELEELLKSAVIKEVNTPVQIMDETSLFLHRKAEDLPAGSRETLVKLHQSDEMIKYKKVLVVDDDIRNIFALTTILERHNMKVVPAENGYDAINILETTPDIKIILMDIMMPVMDGYETTRAIREMPEFKDLPIIALTAKAMKGDREACLEAGASDYITKPVNSAQLLSMIRRWLDAVEGTEPEQGIGYPNVLS